MKSKIDALWKWLDERLDLSQIIAFAQHKTVPQHKYSFWYYWGGISLFLFLVQALTGVLLLIYYRPGPEAFDSVRQITYEINFGWLIRSLHAWAANLMVASIFVHMFSVYFMKAYRAPREFGWWSGMLLLMISTVFGFSGYLLPMNELSYFATKVGLEIPTSMPIIGPLIGDIVRAGPEVSEYTLQRFFALHVVVLPALFVPILVFHLWLVQRNGMALPPSEEARPVQERKTIPFFPNFFMKDLAVWLITLNVLALLAVCFPWDLGVQADALKPAPLGIHPEWYFMSAFQILKVFGNLLPGDLGEAMGVGIFTLGIILWMLIPLYDPDSRSGERARHATYFGLLVLAGVIVLTIWGYAAL
ncbi:MAG: cytochrome bc complex cytochrome b subunit [Candidatus Omnitrophica bacterium]|nr:cytochrome bc complex cytochrome b subunit [Candidatus Omnitrophota bacterium]